MAHKKGQKLPSPKSNGGFRVTYRGYPLYLPDGETLERFKKEYPEKTNAELSEITGHCTTYNSRLGNYLGLEKSGDFKDRRQAAAIKAAKQDTHKGKPPKGVFPEQLRRTCFRKGHQPWTATASKEDLAKRGKNLSKTWRAEYRREDYGLPRKTRLRLKRWTRKQMQDRFYLVTLRHYIEVDDLVFAYDSNTKRSPIKERRGDYPFYSLEEWQNGKRKSTQTTADRDWSDKQGGFNFV